MNAEGLLKFYEQISEAPDAVKQLRRFVLDLAVRGKLVGPLVAEGTGTELASEIAADKAAKTKAGVIKPPKLPKGANRETGLEIPDHWQPIHMAELLDEIQTGPFGSSLKKSDYIVGGVPVINPASIINETIRPVPEMAVGSKTLDRLASFKLRRGDIVLARRGEMGRCAVIGDTEAGWLCGTGSLILRPSKLLFAQYLVLLIGSPYSRNYLAGSAVGATMQNLNQNILLSMPIGLPPEPEQHRIVAKVNELMGLCDRLEAARAAREEVRDKLTAASLARLTAPDAGSTDTPDQPTEASGATGTTPTAIAFQTHARFAIETLPALTSRPDQIKTLRQTTLNLAVRGKLVEQDPADEPASVLLAKIAETKQEILKATDMRKPRKAPEMDPADIWAELPSNWVWTQISDLGFISPRNDEADETKASFVPMPLIAAEYGAANGHEPRQWGAIKKGYTHFAEGDVGLAKITPCFENGKSTVFRNLTGGFGGGTTELHVLRPVLVDPDFVILFLKSPQFIETGIPRMTGTAGQKRVPSEFFTSYPFPLPPLAEQHRIVAKVDTLMALCDRLEAALTTADTTRTRLLNALLHEALTPATPIPEAAE